MKPILKVLRIALLSWGLIAAAMGCGGSVAQHGDAVGGWGSSQGGNTIEHAQVETLRAEVDRLRAASHEALTAALAIGTADLALAEARGALASAEQQLREAEVAYAAHRYQQGWEQLGTARMTLQRAEEAAVRAGLAQIDRTLAEEYSRSAARKPQREPSQAAAQVNQGVVNLREGAGTAFPIVGKARLGEVLEILEESPDWYRVRTPGGQLGWVLKSLLTRLP